jgi:GT2 family glycosyltransferase
MTISVIIPTYNGAHGMLNTIQALEKQTYQDFETVVVVDGSTDNTLKILQDYESSLKELRIKVQPNGGRAKVRNRGAKEAKGELLIFYDDDTRPEPNSIELHTEFHKSKNAICVGFPLEDETKMTTDFLRYRRLLSLKWTAIYQDGLTKLNDKNLFFTAANMSILKETFLQLGGFNESLSDAEDFELGVRAIEKGFDIFFDKANIAWHDDFISCRSYIKRQREYLKASYSLNSYIKEKYRRTALTKKSLSLYQKSVYWFFSSKWWLPLIEEKRLVFIPQIVRYKIYDFVITSLGRIYTEKELT